MEGLQQLVVAYLNAAKPYAIVAGVAFAIGLILGLIL